MLFKKLFCKHEYRETVRYYKYDFHQALSAYIESECVKCNKIKTRLIVNERFYTIESFKSVIEGLRLHGYMDKTFD